MAAKVFDTKGVDSREKARFHVNMIMGTRFVTIVDTKFKPLVRAMTVDVDDTITEQTFQAIFTDITEALAQSGNMADDESAACITFPEGTTVRETPLPEGVN
jgi:hypothetical protein